MTQPRREEDWRCARGANPRVVGWDFTWQQGAQGLSATATAGGSVTVNVGTNDASITVTNQSTGGESRVAPSPGKDTSIPIPNVPTGTILQIKVGRGINARIIYVEVVASGL